ncbi:MAG TPA: hypothetical protein V6C97_33685 [Oculatellaceae cyanobacterium]
MKIDAMVMDKLTSEVEKGHGCAIADIVKRMPFDDALQVLSEIQTRNASHSASDPNLPAVTFDVMHLPKENLVLLDLHRSPEPSSNALFSNETVAQKALENKPSLTLFGEAIYTDNMTLNTLGWSRVFHKQGEHGLACHNVDWQDSESPLPMLDVH